jgi:hypothetical protein
MEVLATGKKFLEGDCLWSMVSASGFSSTPLAKFKLLSGLPQKSTGPRIVGTSYPKSKFHFIGEFIGRHKGF